jgi:predicted secreted hydrolase
VRLVRAIRPASVAGLALVVAACSGGLMLANPPLAVPAPPTATPVPSRPADPVPIVFPRDDGPHDRLTEWWYYTGHLQTADGRHFGFEAVIFRAERGDLPVSWASHLALTDETAGRFLYAQRSEIGAQVDRSPRNPSGAPTGFALDVAPEASPGGGATPPWTLEGSHGRDHITAALSASEAAAAGGSFGLALNTTPSQPVLHDMDGWVPFGPAGGSYYYSRMALGVDGVLTLDGVATRVTGSAWFDHQWGDFISVGGGGWDWFAVNLGDHSALTLSLVRAADGSYPLVYGTYVLTYGGQAVQVVHLASTDFTVTSTGTWTSPHTGATYPSGWRIAIPSRDLVVVLAPTVADQELDTRATTGVVYWEGSQHVTASVGGQPLGGEAYVELTGYAEGAAPTP